VHSQPEAARTSSITTITTITTVATATIVQGSADRHVIDYTTNVCDFDKTRATETGTSAATTSIATSMSFGNPA